jgi:hypothetical protein
VTIVPSHPQYDVSKPHSGDGGVLHSPSVEQLPILKAHVSFAPQSAFVVQVLVVEHPPASRGSESSPASSADRTFTRSS